MKEITEKARDFIYEISSHAGEIVRVDVALRTAKKDLEAARQRVAELECEKENAQRELNRAIFGYQEELQKDER